MILHYANGSAATEWLRTQLEMETEGATSPAQQTYHGECEPEVANCDCCDLRPGTHTVYAGGIETWICDECSDPAPRWARRSVANAWQDRDADDAGVPMYGEI